MATDHHFQPSTSADNVQDRVLNQNQPVIMVGSDLQDNINTASVLNQNLDNNFNRFMVTQSEWHSMLPNLQPSSLREESNVSNTPVSMSSNMQLETNSSYVPQSSFVFNNPNPEMVMITADNTPTTATFSTLISVDEFDANLSAGQPEISRGENAPTSSDNITPMIDTNQQESRTQSDTPSNSGVGRGRSRKLKIHKPRT